LVAFGDITLEEIQNGRKPIVWTIQEFLKVKYTTKFQKRKERKLDGNIYMERIFLG
jgi:hypothetical protein